MREKDKIGIMWRKTIKLLSKSQSKFNSGLQCAADDAK